VGLTNIEVVRDQYDAVNERDFARAMGHYSDDVELIAAPSILGGVFRGRDAVGAWFGDWFRSFDHNARFEIREIAELEGGAVLVVADHEAKGRASGVGVRAEFIWLYHLREGKVVHVWGHETREQALEAARHGPPDA
jgi:ketosteroid isomerase-like protein